MNYLNNILQIIHRDLKCANLFLDVLKEGEKIKKLKVVIGDFGTTLHAGHLEGEQTRFICGTYRWKVNKFQLATSNRNTPFLVPAIESKHFF